MTINNALECLTVYKPSVGHGECLDKYCQEAEMSVQCASYNFDIFCSNQCQSNEVISLHFLHLLCHYNVTLCLYQSKFRHSWNSQCTARKIGKPFLAIASLIIVSWKVKYQSSNNSEG